MIGSIASGKSVSDVYFEDNTVVDSAYAFRILTTYGATAASGA